VDRSLLCGQVYTHTHTHTQYVRPAFLTAFDIAEGRHRQAFRSRQVHPDILGRHFGRAKCIQLYRVVISLCILLSCFIVTTVFVITVGL
jgi:hypothetical protein